MADWRPWPLIIIPPTAGLMVLLQAPPNMAVIGGIILGVIMVIAAILGERTVVETLAITEEDVVCVGRAERLHRVPLWRVQEVPEVMESSAPMTAPAPPTGRWEACGPPGAGETTSE